MQHKRIRQNFMVFRLINRKNLKGLCDKWKNFLELNQGFVAMKTSVRAGGRGDQGAYRLWAIFILRKGVFDLFQTTHPPL